MTETPLVRLFNGRKFVWDGEKYDGEEAAEAIERSYRDQGFEVQRVSDGSAFLLYTRRTVSSSQGISAGEEVEND